MSARDLRWAEEHYRLVVAAHDRTVNLYLDSVEAVREARQHLHNQQRKETNSG